MHLLRTTATVVGLLFFALSGQAQTAPPLAQIATIGKGGTFACTSWAAWREFTQASLTAKGARYGKACPIHLKAGQKVEIVEDDAGAGASAVKADGKTWYVDNDKLDTRPQNK